MSILKISLLILLVAKDGDAYRLEDESELQAKLLTGYNVNVRPSRQVLIRCGLAIRNILSLNIVEQTFSVSGALAVFWSDSRLAWNESDYGNITNIFLRTNEVWKPTLVLQNSAVGIETIGDNSNQQGIPLTASSSGQIFWLAPGFFVSFCDVDISKFPFDTQTCELVISGWLFANDSITYSPAIDKVALDNLQPNGEFDVIKTYTRKDVEQFGSYIFAEKLVFGIQLRRKYSYYLINVVLPVFFMQLLGIMVFLVPAESGEKLTFSLTLLLSLAVMMTLISEKIPTTSLQIPILSVYLISGTIISSLELIMTVIILRIEHCHPGDQAVGKIMQILAKLLASFTCKRTNKIHSETNSKEDMENLKVEEVEEKQEMELKVAQTAIVLADAQRYSNHDIAAMLDRFSLLLFSVLTLMLTIFSLARIL